MEGKVERGYSSARDGVWMKINSYLHAFHICICIHACTFMLTLMFILMFRCCWGRYLELISVRSFGSLLTRIDKRDLLPIRTYHLLGEIPWVDFCLQSDPPETSSYYTFLRWAPGSCFPSNSLSWWAARSPDTRTLRVRYNNIIVKIICTIIIIIFFSPDTRTLRAHTYVYQTNRTGAYTHIKARGRKKKKKKKKKRKKMVPTRISRHEEEKRASERARERERNQGEREQN